GRQAVQAVVERGGATATTDHQAEQQGQRRTQRAGRKQRIVQDRIEEPRPRHRRRLRDGLFLRPLGLLGLGLGFGLCDGRRSVRSRLGRLGGRRLDGGRFGNRFGAGRFGRRRRRRLGLGHRGSRRLGNRFGRGFGRGVGRDGRRLGLLLQLRQLLVLQFQQL